MSIVVASILPGMHLNQKLPHILLIIADSRPEHDVSDHP